jgi:hypothetical protein
MRSKTGNGHQHAPIAGAEFNNARRPPSQPMPAEGPVRAAEDLVRIAAAQRELRRAKAEYRDSRQRAKTLQRAYQVAQDDLATLIETVTTPSPLFDGVPDLEGEVGDVQLRQPTPLAMLELRQSLGLALTHINVRTVEDLRTFCRFVKLQDVSGIGPDGAREINDALTSFYGRGREEV